MGINTHDEFSPTKYSSIPGAENGILHLMSEHAKLIEKQANETSLKLNFIDNLNLVDLIKDVTELKLKIKDHDDKYWKAMEDARLSREDIHKQLECRRLGEEKTHNDIAALTDSVQEVLDLYRDTKGAFRIGKIIGVIMKFIAGVFGICLFFYTFSNQIKNMFFTYITSGALNK